MTRRTAAFCEFLSTQLPTPPARVLEVGCGRGELAQALAERGFDIVAIDPDAPDGEIFRRVRLEDFSDSDGFDAVVASVSLHHIHNLAAAVDKIAAFLPPGGILALEEFAKDRLVGETARWYHGQRRALATTGRGNGVLLGFDEWERESRKSLADIHTVTDIRA
jgi:2-polyprenyl-3-methyl-5-hydroxy-6-metoxy-1,4-benzoquinol methylase